MKNIKEIVFPNKVADIDKKFYEVGINCDKIEWFCKNGEMADIGWFRIIKDNNVITEIRESICDIYGEDKIEEDKKIPF